LSVFITDVWPKRGASFIRVESKTALTEFPYADARERAEQLAHARELAAREAQSERSDVVDNSTLTHVPMHDGRLLDAAATAQALASKPG
jgi:hypothetical protein